MSSLSAAPPTADIGVIGLGVMGENQALNLEDHGYRVALWNHTEAKVTRLIQGAGANRQWIGTRTLEEFAAALSRPRRILLMIKARAPVGEMLEKLHVGERGRSACDAAFGRQRCATGHRSIGEHRTGAPPHTQDHN